MRLFGSLGSRELNRTADAILEMARSPRETLCVDFEGVDHLDYRALADLVIALARTRNRGSFVWLVGLSDYVRSLFHVAGQGAALDRLEWPGGAAIRPAPRRPATEDIRETTESIRLEAWSMAGL
ncbi:MAG: STAS domain-containing protein [Candidatus Eiseniibacteriota bacterium]